jgi:hypothetical protein
MNIKIDTEEGGTFLSINDGEKQEVKDQWWEDDVLVFSLVNGDKLHFTNVYPTAVHFHGLEYDSNEEITIETTTKWSPPND